MAGNDMKPRKVGLKDRQVGWGGQKCRCCKVNSAQMKQEHRRIRRILKQGTKNTHPFNGEM